MVGRRRVRPGALGLMIVRLLVEAHGGRVRAESGGKGHGAIFSVDFPLGEGLPAAPGAPQAVPDKALALAGLRALVLEDHADSRDFVKAALRVAGADVRDAGSAGEALAILAAVPVDIVVSDLGMPQMDGYAFLHSLRKGDGPGHDVPVIALTASASAQDRDRALAAGFCAHVGKPVSAVELVGAVAPAARRTGT
jgi:CheY-like chemotaxis protein